MTLVQDEKESTNEDPIIEENDDREMAPRFTKPDSLIRLIAKPSGNMAKFKCAAEGKALFFGKRKFIN